MNQLIVKHGTSRWSLLLGFSLMGMVPIYGGEGLLNIGVQSQGAIDFEPGQDWMTGLDVGYSNHNLFNHKLELRGAYLTSRIEAIFRENRILREDWLLAASVWHFRRNNFFDPTIQFDVGYQRYDTEFAWAKKLDNSTWLLGAKLGLAMNFSGGKYSLGYGVGYQQAFSQSSKVYPLPFYVRFSILML